MELPGIVRLDRDDDRCAKLRWKGMFIEAEWDPTVPHSNDRLFWCMDTQKCLGPDSQAVDEYDCNETRKCYTAL
jgi:hypothetical protein